MNRKDFLRYSPFAILGVSSIIASCSNTEKKKNMRPIFISTWNDGIQVNQKAWKKLQNNGNMVDAIEVGANYIEDQINCCVGLGGNPDRNGIVTLDASIMDGFGKIGSVAMLERIKHPISVARRVMDKTPHVLLVGSGAQQFALEEGFELESGALSESAKEEYKKWLEKSQYKPVINIENSVPMRLSNGEFNHDTMATIGIDNKGNMAGGVTTSGMGFKMRGRVGDSPIIGAGLFVDNDAGAATSSGMGEEVIRIVGSHLVVEFMRQGKSPEEACKAAIMRIIDKKGKDNLKDTQVGFIAINKNGEYGAFAIQKGFVYAVKTENEEKLIDSPYFLK